MPSISEASLNEFAVNLLSAGGLPADEAQIVGHSLVGANLRGHDSHGVMRIPFYLDAMSKNEVVAGAKFDVLNETATLLAADGNWGFGQTQASRLTERLIEKCKTQGGAVGTLIRSSHVGRLGEYCERAAELGFVSMMMVNTHGHARRVAPPGGTSPRLGTNPLAMGSPGPGGPLVLDFGTSATAEGKVRVKKFAGQQCPEGWLLDSAGKPTTDPNALYVNPPGSIRPMGGDQAYKGFGLALMVEIFAGAVSGGVCVREKPINQNGNCVFMMLIDPGQLGGSDHFCREVIGLTEFIRGCPRIDPNGEILLPGDPERRMLTKRRAEGVFLDDGNWNELTKLADKLKVAAPKSFSQINMPDQIAIKPTLRAVNASIRPPGSKSITNRALICAALAEGASKLTGALDSEDTQVMVDALKQLGLSVKHDVDNATIDIIGCGGKLPRDSADLFCANSGTTIRFLTGMVATGHGRFRLDGVERMHERPIEDLLAALRQLGADAVSEQGNGCPPVVINARGMSGGKAKVRGNISSQFLSGLLMAAAYCQNDVDLSVEGVLVSVPYVHMTLAVMEAFGVQAFAELEREPRINIAAGQKYQGREYAIEPDASAASYFWALAAVTGGRVLVEGLTEQSLQGDVYFVDCLQKMGCKIDVTQAGIAVQGGPLRGVEVNMNAISDTAQTLGVVALFANGPTTITGVEHMRFKETDRVVALATELRKLGATVEEFPDGLRITPGAFRAAAIDTYRDHRMAMSFALAGLKIPGVVINDPGCTAKTYPNFFEDLSRAVG